MQDTVSLEVPDHFSFRSTVYSHGWSELAPFALDEANWRLTYVFSLASGKPVSAIISEEKGKVRVDLARPISDTTSIINETRHLLRLDDDLDGLYESIRDYERLRWVGERGAGRMLRSPTVWEDLVKTICTTNCSWALTKIMVTNLVEKLGETTCDESWAFPTAEAMASQTEAFYREEIRAGYRSPYFVELAELLPARSIRKRGLVPTCPLPN